MARQHSRPQSRLALLTVGDWARGSALVLSLRWLRGPSGSGDENGLVSCNETRDFENALIWKYPKKKDKLRKFLFFGEKKKTWLPVLE